MGFGDYGGTSQAPSCAPEAIDSLLALQYRHLFEKVFAQRMRGAIDADIDFSNAIAGVPPLTTQFSNTSLSRKFRMIAMTIAAREALCMKRQTFFVEIGGWDHHDEVILNQEAMLPIVSHALSEFASALVELDVVDRGHDLHRLGLRPHAELERPRLRPRVGRQPHGDGAGGRRRRHLRELPRPRTLGNSLDTGRGRLIPTTSVDAVLRAAGPVVRRAVGGPRARAPEHPEVLDPGLVDTAARLRERRSGGQGEP
mgnify:CR=1 FL=1